jgi:hypothetical protein
MLKNKYLNQTRWTKFNFPVNDQEVWALLLIDGLETKLMGRCPKQKQNRADIEINREGYRRRENIRFYSADISCMHTINIQIQ